MLAARPWVPLSYWSLVGQRPLAAASSVCWFHCLLPYPLLWSVLVSQIALPTIPARASHCWPHCTLGCHGLATHEVLSTSRMCELH